MQEKYEQAIKETFEYLNQCLKEQDKLDPLVRLQSLGVDKEYVIESQMRHKGFNIKVKREKDAYIVFPHENNLPIHIWRESR